MGKAQCVVLLCKVWHLLHLWCLRICYVKVFGMPRHLTKQKHVKNLPWTDTKVTQFVLCMIFLMYVATIQNLNDSRQESKQESQEHNLKFIFLTHLWPWNSQCHQTYNKKFKPWERLSSCKVWKISH